MIWGRKTGLATVEPPALPTTSTDAMFDQLGQFDYVTVGKHAPPYTNGWFCHIKSKSHVNGATFEVRSDYGHKTPQAAMAQCLERLAATLR